LNVQPAQKGRTPVFTHVPGLGCKLNLLKETLPVNKERNPLN